MRGKIGISGLTFTAFHGVYAEEQVHGNSFTVDCSLDTHFPETGDVLQNVVDYTLVHRIIEIRMHERYDLLETLCRVICLDILNADVRVESVYVRVSKSQEARWGNGALSYAELQLHRQAR